MTDRVEVFYKLVLIDIVDRYIDYHKKKLQKDLKERASDPNIFKRRFRMLGQLAQLESQLYKKIYHFQGDGIDDYTSAIHLITSDIANVVNISS